MFKKVGNHCFLYLIALTIVSSGCKKDDDPVIVIPEFKLGMHNKFIYAATLDPAHSIEYGLLSEVQYDVDNDGSDDFEISSWWSASSGGVRKKYRSVKVLSSDFYISYNGSSGFGSPIVYSYGDTLRNNELWSQDFLQFTFVDRSQLGGQPPINIIMGEWYDLENKYLLFKKLKNGTTVYGWFKLSFKGDSEIRVHEYAIQR